MTVIVLSVEFARRPSLTVTRIVYVAGATFIVPVSVQVRLLAPVVATLSDRPDGRPLTHEPLPTLYCVLATSDEPAVSTSVAVKVVSAIASLYCTVCVVDPVSTGAS